MEATSAQTVVLARVQAVSTQAVSVEATSVQAVSVQAVSVRSAPAALVQVELLARMLSVLMRMLSAQAESARVSVLARGVLAQAEPAWATRVHRAAPRFFARVAATRPEACEARSLLEPHGPAPPARSRWSGRRERAHRS